MYIVSKYNVQVQYFSTLKHNVFFHYVISGEILRSLSHLRFYSIVAFFEQSVLMDSLLFLVKLKKSNNYFDNNLNNGHFININFNCV